MQFYQARDFIIHKLSTELSPELSYHSIEHVNDVYNACNNIAREEGVTGEDLELLLTAALFHDAGFLVQSKDHEIVSCELVKTHLPAFQYSEQHIAVICGMIMATRLPQPRKDQRKEHR